MKNQYVGDIGDYGKYGLLRYLSKRGIKAGINWYLTEDDDSHDEKYTSYLRNSSYRIYDPELFDALGIIAGRPDKSIGMIEEYGLIPNAVYYSEIIKVRSTSQNKNNKSREIDRRLWFNNSKEDALPHGWENMKYENFLVERRRLMAARIKEAFETLQNNIS